MEFKESWNNRVLIVDDQKELHRDFEEMLNPDIVIEASTDKMAESMGFDVNENFLPDFDIIHADNGKTAYKKVEDAIKSENPIAVAYIDIRMPPGWDGVETTRRIREIDKNIEIVIMTGQPDRTLPEITRNMELLNKLLYIRKPFNREMIQQMTISLVEKWNVERELMIRNRQIEINNQHLEAVLNSTGDAIAMLDVDGNLLFANRCYRNMFKLDHELMNSMQYHDFREHMRDRFQEPNAFEKVEKFLADDSDDIIETIVEIKSDGPTMLYQYIAPVRDAVNGIIGYIIVYRDFSKELEIEEMKAEVLRLRAELEKEYSFDNIIGKSKKMMELYALMKQAIQSDITVLIRGESGTGKELVAKSIHFNSHRKSGPFVAVNCAAIPETLIESELFGHEKGSFTGASARRIGKFEQANGGTILLDEIGEMHPNLQARLLRVLQEREIQRIGGTNTIPVDVRIIASTNKDLEEAIEDGDFREDLYYRIAAFPIHLPALREHVEDIPIMSEHFLRKASDRDEKSITLISKEAFQILMNYNWPGNVRELENVIDRAVLLETSSVLQPESLPSEIRDYHEHKVKASDEEISTDEIHTLAEMEKNALIRALDATGDNIRQTAKLLGINRATVYRKMEKYSLMNHK
ncbi:response regulator [Candidatus Poribacteria bacterium]|nr:response regulator [Candidatus Poribacteria bacterium]